MHNNIILLLQNSINKDIKTITEKYFDIKTKEKQILSRAFYKLWEILFIFDILPYDNSITTAHLAEGPGSFVQSVIMFRDKFNKDKSNNDKYCAITLDNNNKDNPYLNNFLYSVFSFLSDLILLNKSKGLLHLDNSRLT